MLPVMINAAEAYRLDAVDCYLFSWFCVKQRQFGYKPFYYGRERIEQETGIKRKRLENFVKMMSDIRILTYEDKSNNIGKVRYYHVNFEAIVNNAEHILNPNHPLSAEIVQSFKKEWVDYLNQKKGDEDLKIIMKFINDIFKERYNNFHVITKSESPEPYNILDCPLFQEQDLIKLYNMYEVEELAKGLENYFDTWLRNNKWGKCSKNPLEELLIFDERRQTFVHFYESLEAYHRKRGDVIIGYGSF